MSFLAFLVAVAYLPGVPSASLVGRWWVAAAGVSFLLWRAPATRVDRLALVLMAWCAASLFWSESPLDTAGGLFHLCVMAGVFVLAAETDDLRAVLSGFGLGVSVSAVFSVLQYFGVQPVINISDHPVGLFLSKNGVVEAAFPVLAWALLARRWWLVPGAFISVALSGSKETWLMTLAAVAVVVFSEVRRTARGAEVSLGLLLLGLALMGAVAVALLPEANTGTLNERLAIWQATLAAWWALHPVLGFGFGTYPSLMPGIEYAHNDFLQLLFEVGPIGLVLAGAVVLRAVAAGSGNLAEKAALASLLAAGLVWWPLYQPASAFLVALLAGHLCGARGRRRVAERGGGGDRLAGVRHYGLPYRAAALRPAGAGASGMAAGAQPALGAAAVRD